MSQTSANILISYAQEVLQFLLLLLRILGEICKCMCEAILPVQLSDVSAEIVLVTGAGHGIGREIALQYAALESTVICVDLNAENNAETVNLAKRNGAKSAVHGFTCDVGSRDAVLQLANKIKESVGAVTILVNNAGIMPTHPLERHSVEEIRKVFDVNVFAHFWTLEAFLPLMKAQGRGHIICISSIAGLVGTSNLVPYTATKFAVRGMMEALHEEIRESSYQGKIKTTTIYPYMVNTGLCKHPKVKYPAILSLLEPKYVANRVIYAQRSNMVELTIPRCLLAFNHAARLFPINCGLMLKDYMGSGIDSDLID